MKIIIFLIYSIMVIYLSACSGCANTDRTTRTRQNANRIENPILLENQPEIQNPKTWEGITEINMVSEMSIAVKLVLRQFW